MTGLITIPQAAALLKVSKQTAYRRIDETGSLYGVRVQGGAGHQRVSAEAIERLLSGAA